MGGWGGWDERQKQKGTGSSFFSRSPLDVEASEWMQLDSCVNWVGLSPFGSAPSILLRSGAEQVQRYKFAPLNLVVNLSSPLPGNHARI